MLMLKNSDQSVHEQSKQGESQGTPSRFFFKLESVHTKMIILPMINYIIIFVLFATTHVRNFPIHLKIVATSVKKKKTSILEL